jgi:hypothetical protein
MLWGVGIDMRDIWIRSRLQVMNVKMCRPKGVLFYSGRRLGRHPIWEFIPAYVPWLAAIALTA